MQPGNLIPVWESHMAEREAGWHGYRPHWYLSPRYIYRMQSNPAYDEYVIEDFKDLRYFTHEDIWQALAEASS